MTSIPTRFKTAFLAAIAATTSLTIAAPALADGHMEAKKDDIVATAMGTGMHETLVTAVKAADLVETLSKPGAITVFAPTDAAFAKLPDGTVATLVKPENKETLTGILTYHVVGGNITSDMIVGYINDSKDGVARIKTLAGGVLEARLEGESVVITDAKGGTATVVAADVMTSNGVIHVTDGVFLPG